MYIKLSFSEKIINIADAWGGLVVTLVQEPIIMRRLPENVAANTAINIKDNRRQTTPVENELIDDTITHDYDYYLDCNAASLPEIKKALRDLKTRYKNKNPAQVTLFSDASVNPVILQLYDALTKLTKSPVKLFDVLQPEAETPAKKQKNMNAWRHTKMN